MVSSMEQSWMSGTPLSPMVKPSILMSREVGREVSTPVTVRWMEFLSTLCPVCSPDAAAPPADSPLPSSASEARSAVELLVLALPSSPAAFRAARAAFFAASSAFFSSFVCIPGCAKKA
jgi:hypothetical protein